MTKTEKKTKFNFAELKKAATSENRDIRKKIFEDYFEMFEEFPSYLFDNEHGIDKHLSETIQDIQNDPNTPQKMQRGIELLMRRMPTD